MPTTCETIEVHFASNDNAPREPWRVMVTTSSHADAQLQMRYEIAWHLAQTGADGIEKSEHHGHEDGEWASIQKIARAFLGIAA